MPFSWTVRYSPKLPLPTLPYHPFSISGFYTKWVRAFGFVRSDLLLITLSKTCSSCLTGLAVISHSAIRRAVAVYPLNRNTKGRDISFSRNPKGRVARVRYAPGPDNSPGGSIKFYGRSNSYVEFPNRGKIDTRRSITLLAWIYHTGRAGPIFNYMPNGWGVHFWMVSPKALFARFTRRRGRRFTPAVYSRTVQPRKWQFVGTTYSYRTGIARLFVNSRFVAAKRVGRFRLATNYPVRMGARVGDRRYFKGRISCMQVYNQALNRNQILVRQKRCFRAGNNSWLATC